MQRLGRGGQWTLYIAGMNPVHVGSFDLNLLLALDALLVEQNVTRAAARLGLTQSAMSHALSRLRALLGDQLLVRGRDGMLPTARAEELIFPVRHALEEISRALNSARTFDPKTASLRFYIGTTDYAEVLLLPRLAARLSQEAPNIDLRAVSLPSDAFAPLVSGSIDVAIAPIGIQEERAGIYARKLFDERFVCVVRKHHPLAKKKLTLARFCAASHALVSPRGHEGGFVDDALSRLGARRRVAVAVPHFLVAPHLVVSSDLVLTLAQRIARLWAQPLGLTLLAPPAELALGGFTMSALWHERTSDDPARRWLRELIVEEARAI